MGARRHRKATVITAAEVQALADHIERDTEIVTARPRYWNRPAVAAKLRDVWATGDRAVICAAFPKHTYDAILFAGYRANLPKLPPFRKQRAPDYWTAARLRLLRHTWPHGRAATLKMFAPVTASALRQIGYTVGLTTKTWRGKP